MMASKAFGKHDFDGLQWVKDEQALEYLT